MALRSFIKKGTAGNGALNYVDGVNITTVGYDSLDTQTGTFTTIGSYTGQSQEIIIYTVDKSSNRTDIEGNISAYYQSAKLLDEQYGSGAEAAYSVRQLKRDNTECMVIRRASDSTTTTIGFDSEGNIDEAAITTFCTGTSCTTYQWIDQSGNGNDATAAAPANEPTIYTGGALVKEGGKLALDFDGASDFFESGAVTTSSQPVTVISTTTPQATAFSGGILNTTDSNNFIDFYRNDGGLAINAGSTISSSFDYVQDDRYLKFSLFNGASSEVWANGYSVLTGNPSTTGISGNLFVGKYLTSSNNFMNGFMQEVLLYSENKSSVRTSIEENIGDYFTQNTPLLDTYSGAAAAYSLRLLDSTYTGSAIRVRRSSDNTEQDIGFNVFGELDTVSLLDFAGTGDAFVKVWYDQASTNDATQTDTAKQPQIVSSGAVIVLGNKPAITGVSSSSVLSIATTINFSDFGLMHVYEEKSNNKMTWGLDSSKYYYHSGASHRINDMINFTSGLTDGDYVLDFANRNSGAVEVDLNGASVSTATNTGGYSFKHLFNAHSLGFGYTAPMQEFVLWTSEQSANRTGIETNINTFYSIY